MKDLELINALRNELAIYERDNGEQISSTSRTYVENMKYAVTLFEKGLLNNIPVSKNDEFYFSGKYHISRFLCDGGYELISELYDKIVDTTISKNYFR